jgi:alpha-galactosidase
MTNVMTKIDPQTLSILQNPAVLTVSQDPMGTSAVRIWRYYVPDKDENSYGEIQLYSGPLAGGDQLVLLLNAGSSDRTMNATLVDIFWEDGPSGTAMQVTQSWDIYDLWGHRMSDETAAAIIDGTVSGTSLPSRLNMTTTGGSKRVYSQVPPSSSKDLMGTKAGTVQASGTVIAEVKAHSVAMFRLRTQSKEQ